MSTELEISGPPIGHRSAILGREGAAATRPAFFALCLYVASQVFTIPVLALGPSWAVWPTLSDFAAGLLAVTAVACPAPLASGVAPRLRQTFIRLLGLLFVGCTLSFLYLLVLFPDPTVGQMEQTWGMFQLYRLLQVMLIFWAASRVPLSPDRLRALGWITTFVFYVVCLSIIGSFFGWIAPEALIQHLGGSKEALGPWYDFSTGLARGWGTVGYNHAYVSAQVILLLALHFRFHGTGPAWAGAVAVLVALVACFLSGSRAGLAAASLMAAAFLCRRPGIGVLAFVAVAILLAAVDPARLPPELSEILESQNALSDPADRENLNGRFEIWDAHLDFLRARPWLWATGAGFGSAVQVGNAHCLFLQLLVDLGAVGLLLWTGFVGWVLRALWKREPAPHALFWSTAALLFASLTQETFYPVPAFGHFLGLYVCGLALTPGFGNQPGSGDDAAGVPPAGEAQP